MKRLGMNKARYISKVHVKEGKDMGKAIEKDWR
jgi:hypothetical protein